MICKGDSVYNLVVIGAGMAGLVTAAGTAGLGGRVAIIEENMMSDVDRAIVEDATSGFVKILTASGSDKILGAVIVAEHAGELLQPLVLAMHARLGLSKVAAAIHPYPTLVEVERGAGGAYNKTKLTKIAKKVFGWLYKRQREKVK